MNPGTCIPLSEAPRDSAWCWWHHTLSITGCILVWSSCSPSRSSVTNATNSGASLSNISSMHSKSVLQPMSFVRCMLSPGLSSSSLSTGLWPQGCEKHIVISKNYQLSQLKEFIHTEHSVYGHKIAANRDKYSVHSFPSHSSFHGNRLNLIRSSICSSFDRALISFFTASTVTILFSASAEPPQPLRVVFPGFSLPRPSCRCAAS